MTKLTVSDTGSLLMGAGLTLLQNNVNLALIVIGFGAVLNIVVAYLQSKGVPVSHND